MTAMLTISTRAVGRRRRLLDDWSVPLPPDGGEGGGAVTLRDLITRIVLETIAAFRARQAHNRFLHALTHRQIDDQAARGKVFSGGSALDQPVDDAAAVDAALRAFEDGLYLVIVDAVEQKNLDAPVFLRPDSRVTFLRLTMLAGG